MNKRKHRRALRGPAPTAAPARSIGWVAIVPIFPAAPADFQIS